MSFKELFDIIKRRFLLIFIMTAVVTLVTGYIQFRVISPVYQASTQVLIHETSGEKKIKSQRHPAESPLQQHVSNDNEKPGCD
jgi:capsular polysaccharide biosynthesis protein